MHISINFNSLMLNRKDLQFYYNWKKLIAKIISSVPII